MKMTYTMKFGHYRVRPNKPRCRCGASALNVDNVFNCFITFAQEM
jgi:hypothetical protein